MSQSSILPSDHRNSAEDHVRRWRRLHDERRFRVEQLAALDAEASASPRHDRVKEVLRIAATSALAEIEAALARAADGRYGLCVSCARPIGEERLDVLPMAALCMPCQYNEQNCHLGGQGREGSI